MARKKKKRRKGDGAVEGAEGTAKTAVPKSISRPFAQALAGMKVGADGAAEEAGDERSGEASESSKEGRRPAPSEAALPVEARADEHGYEDRVAFSQAFAGVKPLPAKKKKGPKSSAARSRAASSEAARRVEPARRDDPDAAARAQLAALVTGGLRFEVHTEEDWVEGRREDAPRRALGDLRQGRAAAEAELDLHGMTGDEAERAVAKFIRHESQRGREIVRIVHGKGLHSAGGSGVLKDRVLRALTAGAAAPFTHAFITAARSGGGSGALLVRLGKR